MIYLTYAEYQEMGGVMEIREFTRFSLMATNTVNRNTRNRVSNDFNTGAITDYADNLKALMFELVELSQTKINSMDSGAVASESNQGMSKSFKQVDAKNVDKLSFELCELYLASYQDRHGTPLMYLGIC